MVKMVINGVEHDIGPGANLRGANLRKANLCKANLRKANLSGAHLYEAHLSWAHLCEANLCEANLCGANLSGANLSGANLSGANLSEANLSWAHLSGADLRGADLREANLRGAENIPASVFATTLIAAEGDLIGYKKLADCSICKLRIPSEAKRSNATGRKCRAEYAIVLEGNGFSRYDLGFEYRVGETVRPREPFCEDRWDECASGIHFFLTREEAQDF